MGVGGLGACIIGESCAHAGITRVCVIVARYVLIGFNMWWVLIHGVSLKWLFIPLIELMALL